MKAVAIYQGSTPLSMILWTDHRHYLRQSVTSEILFKIVNLQYLSTAYYYYPPDQEVSTRYTAFAKADITQRSNGWHTFTRNLHVTVTEKFPRSKCIHT